MRNARNTNFTIFTTQNPGEALQSMAGDFTQNVLIETKGKLQSTPLLWFGIFQIPQDTPKKSLLSLRTS